MSVRSFPMPRWPNRGDGWCAWCGEAVARPARTWHKACLEQYQLHTWPAVQIAFVKDRDGAKCWDCGETAEKWNRGCEARRIGSPDHVGVYRSIRRVSALELEHDVPLWRVAHLPAEDRRRYFGPDNLRLRCPPCHKAKSKLEATERAALKAANQNAPQPKESAA